MSLDVVRGSLVFVSVVCDVILAPRPLQLQHAEWMGVRAIDLIFPLFVTLSGCGLAFAYRRSVSWTATVRRSVVLFAVGMIFGFFAAQSVDPATMKFTGPLQVYAVLVLVIGFFHLWARTSRRWLIITLVLAAIHFTMLLLWQRNCPGGELTPMCNPSLTIDFGVFGMDHVYHQGIYGHDPEGIPSMLGALVTASVGITAGHLALDRRGEKRVVLYLFGLAALFASFGLLSNVYLPAMKRLWTTPFAVEVGALGVLLLAAGMMVMDGPAPRWWTRRRDAVAWMLVAFGRNALLVYFGSHLLTMVLLDHGGEESWAVQASNAIDSIGFPRVSYALAMTALWMVIAGILHRRRIYLHP